MGSKTKTCSRWGKRKPLDAFYRQAGGAQGRRGACKECYRAAERAAWAKNPEVQAARLGQVEKWRKEGLSILRCLDRSEVGCIPRPSHGRREP